jgi:CheY-like chemotaxis protein
MDTTAPGVAVLIVDDDPSVRRLLRLTLHSDDCITYDAADGFEALKILSLATWSVVIVDLNMPGMEGEEFCQRARQRGYIGPVIVLSADVRAKARCARLGVPLVQKPFDPDGLLQMIHELQAPVPQMI